HLLLTFPPHGARVLEDVDLDRVAPEPVELALGNENLGRDSAVRATPRSAAGEVEQALAQKRSERFFLANGDPNAQDARTDLSGSVGGIGNVGRHGVSFQKNVEPGARGPAAHGETPVGFLTAWKRLGPCGSGRRCCWAGTRRRWLGCIAPR